MKAIEVNELKKSFGNVTAVDGISFDVGDNEIFGFVGPDGAGKTTIIRLLCGLLNPTAGGAKILGLDLVKQRRKIQKDIGYLSQKFSLYSDITVDENIEFFADIHGVKDFHNRRNELLEFMRLINFRKFPAGKLSGGMKQKLALACTLIHKPKIIFLDEPTTGVDPVSRRDFWKILSDLLRDGITIVVSTPYLDEAERFKRVAMLDKGKILMCDSPADIKKSVNSKIVEIVCSPVREAFNILKQNTSFVVQTFGDRIDVAINDFDKEYPVLESILRSNGIEVFDHRLKPVSLENVFINLIGKSAN